MAYLMAEKTVQKMVRELVPKMAHLMEAEWAEKMVQEWV